MNLINEHNCEAWFLDYFENNLNAYQTKLLFQFLKDNPRLLEIFKQYEDYKLKPEKTKFNVQTLYKNIPIDLADEISGSDYAAIAFTEGILKNHERKHVDKFLNEDKSFKELVKIYQILKLKPDNSIVFKGKQRLKRPLVISILKNIKLNKYAAAAAALIFVVINTWLFMPKNSNPNLSQFKAARKRPYIERTLRPEKHKEFIVKNVPQNHQLINALVNNSKKVYIKKVNNTELATNYIIENAQHENLTSQSNDQQIIHAENQNTDKSSETNFIVVKNNVKTINNEIFLTPNELIISKWLKTSVYDVPDNYNEKKSRFWQLLELATIKYSENKGKKIKIKKSFNENSTVTFAFIAEKFEFSHTSSKN